MIASRLSGVIVHMFLFGLLNMQINGQVSVPPKTVIEAIQFDPPTDPTGTANPLSYTTPMGGTGPETSNSGKGAIIACCCIVLVLVVIAVIAWKRNKNESININGDEEAPNRDSANLRTEGVIYTGSLSEYQYTVFTVVIDETSPTYETIVKIS